MSEGIQYAYAAFKDCGCMVAVSVDMPKYKKETAKFVKQCIQDGLRIERVDVERARRELLRCPHGKDVI